MERNPLLLALTQQPVNVLSFSINCTLYDFRAPVLLKILMTSVKKATYKFSKQKRIGLLTVICKILNICNVQLNALAKINGLRLQRAGVTKRMILELNKTYDSVSYPTLNRLLDNYGDETVKRVAKWTNDNVHHGGDNVDINLKARHELQGRSRIDLHMYNNLLYRPRINVDHLPDVPPSVPDQSNISLSQFIPNDKEQDQFLGKLKHQIMLSWTKVDAVKDCLKSYPADDTHLYSAEMKTKTEKVSGHKFKIDCSIFRLFTFVIFL